MVLSFACLGPTTSLLFGCGENGNTELCWALLAKTSKRWPTRLYDVIQFLGAHAPTASQRMLRGNEGKKTSQQHRRQDYVELDGRDKKKLLFKGLLNIFASNARRQTTAPH